MIKSGVKLLDSVEKIERLINHNLNITQTIIEERVDSNIKTQLSEKSIETIELDISEVSWNDLINNALKRSPPFEDNKSEKGFRDSLILESFIQLVNNSPKTPSICRIAMVTEDALLLEALEKRTQLNTNIKFCKNLEELESFINILVSKMEESKVTEISSLASLMFFNNKDNCGLYYDENIRDQINNRYKNILEKKPDLIASSVQQGTWFISNVNFVKKEKQRFWWSSPIRIEMSSQKWTSSAVGRSGSANTMHERSLYPKSQSLLDIITSTSNPNIPNINSPIPVLSEHKKGEIKFEIVWSVTLNVKGKLINPKIEEIKYIETNWDTTE